MIVCVLQGYALLILVKRTRRSQLQKNFSSVGFPASELFGKVKRVVSEKIVFSLSLGDCNAVPIVAQWRSPV